MNRFQVIIGQISLAVCALALGLCVCVFPVYPTALFSGWYANVDESPLTQEELVAFASSVHDYTFFDQDRTRFYAEIVQINNHIAEDGRASDGQPVITDGDVESVGAAFDAADDAYVVHTDMVDHLDDVSRVVMIILIVGLVFLTIAATEIMNGYFRGYRGDMCRILIGGGMIALAIIAVALVAGVFAFDGLFTGIHQLLFADGTWTFSSTSALICALPTEFWTAMGALLLAVAAIFAVICIVIGKLVKNYKV